MTLERIDDVQTRHRLSLRVLGVGDGVTDDAFEERLEDTAGFFVDHCEDVSTMQSAWHRKMKYKREESERGGKGRGKEEEGKTLTGRDTLDASTTRETTDGGLGDALDVVAENLAVTLRSAFAEAFATFSACGGVYVSV